nr:DUF6261 family protein [uncultured Carboxylicivirga sp.]
MELINLPRLRNKQLQTVAEDTIRICQPLTEVQPALLKVKATLDRFKLGMIKGQVSATEKVSLDRVRDRLVSGFIHDLKAEFYFPHSDEDKKTLTEVNQIIKKHGSSIVRLPQNEETAAIDNLLFELKQLNQSVFEGNGLSRWLPLIEDANAAYKNAAGEFVDEKADAALVMSASMVAMELTVSLENLYTLLFAHAKVSDNESIHSAYSKIEEIVSALN